MNELVLVQPKVFASAGTALANSVDVAAYFKKRHDTVLRAIRDLRNSAEIDPRDFTETTYVDDRGRTYVAYNMTRDGFSLLAMGFTGEKALAFKVQYIQAFNAMQRRLTPQVALVKPTHVSGALLREMQKFLAFGTAQWNLSSASQQAFATSLCKSAGITIPEPVIPTERYWSTTDLADMWDTAPSVMGKRIKHLKTPENGETRLTTAPHGKRVPQFCGTSAASRPSIR